MITKTDMFFSVTPRTPSLSLLLSSYLVYGQFFHLISWHSFLLLLSQVDRCISTSTKRDCSNTTEIVVPDMITKWPIANKGLPHLLSALVPYYFVKKLMEVSMVFAAHCVLQNGNMHYIWRECVNGGLHVVD